MLDFSPELMGIDTNKEIIHEINITELVDDNKIKTMARKATLLGTPLIVKVIKSYKYDEVIIPNGQLFDIKTIIEIYRQLYDRRMIRKWSLQDILDKYGYSI